MKHLKIGTKVMAASLVTATLAGTIDTTAFAAPVKTEYAISVVSCGEELSETWKELCDKIANGNWSDCPVLPLPGESLPTLPGEISQKQTSRRRVSRMQRKTFRLQNRL